MNIIDALVVTVGLDTSDFVKGQKEAAASLAKTKDQAVKAGKDIEKSAADMTQGLGKATSGVLELFAAFLGGRGLKEFVADSVRANTALSNLGSSLGSSPQLIDAWKMASERMGGSASATMASIQALSDSLVDLRTQGKALPLAFYQLNADYGQKTGKAIDIADGWEKMALGLADASNILAKTDPAKASRLLRSLGIDQVTANLMIEQGARMQAYLGTLKRLGETEADKKASSGLTASWKALDQELGNLATKITTAIAPAMETLANAISAVVGAIAGWVEDHPGWTDAIAVFLGSLAGDRMLAVIRNILALKDALIGLGAANAVGASGGILGFLAANPWIAALVTTGAVMAPSSANEGEDERARQQRYGQSRGGGSGNPLSSGNDALRRRGHQAYRDQTNYTGSNAEVVRQAAQQLGTTPKDLATVIAYETGGTFSPSIHGGRGGGYQGLIQFGAPERAQFGANDKQTFAQQMPAVVSYLKTRGYKPGMSLMDLYSTINAGSPGHYNASDGNGTVASHVARMQTEQAGNVRQFLGNDPQPGVVSADTFMKGMPRTGGFVGLRTGAAQAAALNNISNSTQATTTSSSNEMHIGNIHVNAPNATDAHGIATHIDSALASNMFAKFANYGPN